MPIPRALMADTKNSKGPELQPLNKQTNGCSSDFRSQHNRLSSDLGLRVRRIADVMSAIDGCNSEMNSHQPLPYIPKSNRKLFSLEQTSGSKVILKSYYGKKNYSNQLGTRIHRATTQLRMQCILASSTHVLCREHLTRHYLRTSQRCPGTLRVFILCRRAGTSIKHACFRVPTYPSC